jgi:hypothetical protein
MAALTPIQRAFNEVAAKRDAAQRIAGPTEVSHHAGNREMRFALRAEAYDEVLDLLRAIDPDADPGDAPEGAAL